MLFGAAVSDNPAPERADFLLQSRNILAGGLQSAFGHRALELLALELGCEALDLHLVGAARRGDLLF